MKIKRYVGSDMRHALRAAKEALGADAVMLSNRAVAEGVEITVAVDYDEEAIAKMPSSDDLGGIGRHADAVHRQAATAADAGPEVLEDMRRQLSDLRGMLEGELSQLAWREMARRQPLRAALVARLQGLGLSRDLCMQIAKQAATGSNLKEAWKLALRRLASMLIEGGEDILERGGVVAIVGSTGVGKTTTVAKLAARFALRNGRKQVGLISTDCFRIGGQEQLDTFGRIIGVPVLSANSADNLARAIEELKGRKLILIDTAGMSQRDLGLAQQFATLRGAGRDVKTYLTLSATSQRSITDEVVKTFSKVPLAGAIVTKTDETASLGPVLSVLVGRKLPVSYIGNGQRVPEDMQPARRVELVKSALRLMEQVGWESPAPPPLNSRGRTSAHG